MATINAKEVLTKLRDLAAETVKLNGLYKFLVDKSFLVLEGMGWSNNPEYSIINEYLHYIASRLLTDTQTMDITLNTFVLVLTRTIFWTHCSMPK
jgi:hypothetical protein